MTISASDCHRPCCAAVGARPWPRPVLPSGTPWSSWQCTGSLSQTQVLGQFWYLWSPQASSQMLRPLKLSQSGRLPVTSFLAVPLISCINLGPHRYLFPYAIDCSYCSACSSYSWYEAASPDHCGTPSLLVLISTILISFPFTPQVPLHFSQAFPRLRLPSKCSDGGVAVAGFTQRSRSQNLQLSTQRIWLCDISPWLLQLKRIFLNHNGKLGRCAPDAWTSDWSAETLSAYILNILYYICMVCIIKNRSKSATGTRMLWRSRTWPGFRPQVRRRSLCRCVGRLGHFF